MALIILRSYEIIFWDIYYKNICMNKKKILRSKILENSSKQRKCRDLIFHLGIKS
ncbi:hypothetical protein FH063_002262 [Azospirillum argentinense]|uniref:Uncharacterized protein n=1 Tax=Azospirillum argentinense TaxID=2970906 RepID=A0A5B0KMW3_9PROT|nr:hypothetical protein FH063_002262 [Azospirillum argentinense]